MKTDKSRIQWIDFARVFAILCVTLVHATEGFYVMNVDSLFQKHIFSQIFAMSCFTAGRLGVPIFLMISGYLLLDRQYTEEGCAHFWGKNWIGLLRTTLIWFIIYDIFLALTNHEPFNILNLLKELLFLRRIDLSHAWYLPMIVGMYVLIPFAANALRSFRIQTLYFPYIFFSAYVFILPTINIVLTALNWKIFSKQLYLSFSGNYYGLYLVMGYIIKKDTFKNIKSTLLKMIGFISFCAAVFLQWFSYSKGITYNVWYDCAFLLICSGCLFELFSRLNHDPGYSLIRSLSKYSFAIYLMHILIRKMVLPHITPLNTLRPVKVVFLWWFITLTSWAIALLINRIPKMGKLFFNLK